jgi:hypothetical protein
MSIDKACDKQINGVLTDSSHKVFDLAQVLVFANAFRDSWWFGWNLLWAKVYVRLSVAVVVVGWYHFTTEWFVQECDVVSLLFYQDL